MLDRIFKELINDSPRANFAKLRNRLAGRTAKPAVNLSENKVLDDLLALPCLTDLLVFALTRMEGGRIVFCGDSERYSAVADRLQKLGRAADFHARTWDQV